jgi:uncharacterized protein Yka (UPF0111/DUF47 family)
VLAQILKALEEMKESQKLSKDYEQHADRISSKMLQTS